MGRSREGVSKKGEGVGRKGTLLASIRRLTPSPYCLFCHSFAVFLPFAGGNSCYAATLLLLQQSRLKKETFGRHVSTVHVFWESDFSWPSRANIYSHLYTPVANYNCHSPLYATANPGKSSRRRQLARGRYFRTFWVGMCCWYPAGNP